MLALKQELRGSMRELPYFVKAKVKTKGENRPVLVGLVEWNGGMEWNEVEI